MRSSLVGLLLLGLSAGASALQCAVLPAEPDMAALRAAYEQPVHCWPAPTVADGVVWREMGPLPSVPFPENNPYSSSKAALGRMLFFDPRLSSSGQIACASCHDPHLGWADGRAVPFGHDRRAGGRNAPTIINAGYLSTMFWDGRADTLEQQALMAMVNPREMNADLKQVMRALARIPEYRERFDAVFGDGDINEDAVARAIATFVRTVTSRTSAFDRFMRGEYRFLSDEQVRGLHLFRTQAGCMNCHHGPLLTDGGFHNIGMHFFGRMREDRGRYSVTGKAEDVGAFRTPGLRDVAFTGPWAHNGLMLTLEGLLNIYNAGGAEVSAGNPLRDDPLYPQTSPLLKPLGLSDQDIQALVAFMEGISRQPQRMSPPPLPGLE
ncbi:cytochrome-c peroxidase [Alcanivorax sp. S71-1-4]|uniref:cytochrome-c peroxidase n=1 Tax=Alcanivorax sp. S71-1-4 TaxID=1177159 RepID=UPI0013595446|nr:cytochrome c peroxidase [Alcanivorax sp. S71-1-4]KAF0810779.1 cytochrome-c peroxidase [Alcanivorax sp. S71-1-4]